MSNPNTPAKRARWKRWYLAHREEYLAHMAEYLMEYRQRPYVKEKDRLRKRKDRSK